MKLPQLFNVAGYGGPVTIWAARRRGSGPPRAVRLAVTLTCLAVLGACGIALTTDGGSSGPESMTPTPTTAALTPTPTVTPSPTPEPTNSPEPGQDQFAPTALPSTPITAPEGTATHRSNPVVLPVPIEQWDRIVAVGAWRQECPVGRTQLRRVEINFVDFSGEVRRGVLVVHRDITRSIIRIFSALYDARWPITRMVPVEEYDGDVRTSLRADNTSAFNCRKPDQINAPVQESPHANGRAIDINPARNPWIDLRCNCWIPSEEHSTNRKGPGVITKNSLPWRLFTAEGWIWQNIKVPDYMHFDTGYPSRPYRARAGKVGAP